MDDDQQLISTYWTYMDFRSFGNVVKMVATSFLFPTFVFLLEKSGRHERFSPGKSAISKVQCGLPFQVRQFSKFSNKRRCVNFTHRFASVWSSVSPFQDRFVFFRNRSHCGLKWAGEGSGAEAPVLPSCATHPPLPVSGSVFGSCAATP